MHAQFKCTAPREHLLLTKVPPGGLSTPCCDFADVDACACVLSINHTYLLSYYLIPGIMIVATTRRRAANSEEDLACNATCRVRWTVAVLQNPGMTWFIYARSQR